MDDPVYTLVVQVDDWLDQGMLIDALEGIHGVKQVTFCGPDSLVQEQPEEEQTMDTLIETKVEPTGDGKFRVTTIDGGMGWRVGVMFPTEAAAQLVADTIRTASLGEPLPLPIGCPLRLSVNGCTVSVAHEVDDGGDHYVKLRGDGCDLEGEMPGEYYPVAK